MKKEAAKNEVAASGPSPGSAVLGQTDKMRSSLGFPRQGEHICFLATLTTLTEPSLWGLTLLVPLLPSCLAEPLSGADCAQCKEEVWPSPAEP